MWSSLLNFNFFFQLKTPVILPGLNLGNTEFVETNPLKKILTSPAVLINAYEESVISYSDRNILKKISLHIIYSEGLNLAFLKSVIYAMKLYAQDNNYVINLFILSYTFSFRVNSISSYLLLCPKNKVTFSFKLHGNCKIV